MELLKNLGFQRWGVRCGVLAVAVGGLMYQYTPNGLTAWTVVLGSVLSLAAISMPLATGAQKLHEQLVDRWWYKIIFWLAFSAFFVVAIIAGALIQLAMAKGGSVSGPKASSPFRDSPSGSDAIWDSARGDGYYSQDPPDPFN